MGQSAGREQPPATRWQGPSKEHTARTKSWEWPLGQAPGVTVSVSLAMWLRLQLQTDGGHTALSQFCPPCSFTGLNPLGPYLTLQRTLGFQKSGCPAHTGPLARGAHGKRVVTKPSICHPRAPQVLHFSQTGACVTTLRVAEGLKESGQETDHSAWWVGVEGTGSWLTSGDSSASVPLGAQLGRPGQAALQVGGGCRPCPRVTGMTATFVTDDLRVPRGQVAWPRGWL